jgi:hypothetical protein
MDSKKLIKTHERVSAVINQCDFCQRVFTRSNNLGKHLKTCVKKKNHESENDLQKYIKKLNDQLELFKNEKKHFVNEKKHFVKEVNHYKGDAEYYKQMLMEAGGLVRKSVSALTYSITNYDEAPLL